MSQGDRPTYLFDSFFQQGSDTLTSCLKTERALSWLIITTFGLLSVSTGAIFVFDVTIPVSTQVFAGILIGTFAVGAILAGIMLRQIYTAYQIFDNVSA